MSRRGSEQVVALLTDRVVDTSPGYCNMFNGARGPGGLPPIGAFTFDPAGGALLVRMQISDTDGIWKYRVFRFAGLTSTFELLQTFTPNPHWAFASHTCPRACPPPITATRTGAR